jgi:hypothetical protein
MDLKIESMQRFNRSASATRDEMKRIADLVLKSIGS